MLWTMVIALAVLQGLTEFLPVSSSGHLRLLEAVFGVHEPQTLFDIFLHVGSLVAVFIVYRAVFGRMIVAIGRALRRPAGVAEQLRADPDLRLFVFACLATIPTAVIALLLDDTFEAMAAHVGVVGGALIVNGFILLLLGSFNGGRLAAFPEKRRRPLAEIRLADALFIGLAQGVGVIRGISRSGSTITAAMATGLDRDAAATFSFVLAVPAILGALVMKLRGTALASDALAHAIVGAVVAAVVGTAALLLLLRLLRGGRLHHFAWYCFALGVAAIAWELAS
ncbi:MAG: undecaprenyl-diphosphate phosphatase [Deltaproteobacteria bacterium]|nr:undecaprenyl-diphosphate phosphatase [Deltaproteobacteria bacterium]